MISSNYIEWLQPGEKDSLPWDKISQQRKTYPHNFMHLQCNFLQCVGPSDAIYSQKIWSTGDHIYGAGPLPELVINWTEQTLVTHDTK